MNNKKEFSVYLDNLIQEKRKNKGEPYSPSTKDNFISRLENIDKDIFLIVDSLIVLGIINSIKSGKKDYDNRYSTTTALSHYLKFLEEKSK
ncbi:MAG: Unknown protein [uncultured Sulfurovum sp.]|uniref:Uncharacterized protein n=1 Tax=uncultured Sulfurovum sp. TaxID=269237 RepID=A0A6S6SBK9_9BACT|nr:MAG: Unknown protein [uncultured Sulfurovum sp.]